MLSSEYILILLWLAAVFTVTRIVRFEHSVYVSGNIEQRYSWIFALIVFIPIIWMAANRADIGDSYNYKNTFLEMPSTIAGFFQYMDPTRKDWAYYALAVLIKVIFGEDTRTYFLVIALIQGLILVSVFRKYSPNYLASVFLFVASTDYISWMYNGVRQFTAVTIIIAGTGWMIEHKHIRVIILILIAAQFHQSALVMIPIYFIAQGKAWNQRTMLFIVFAILTVVFVDRFTNILDQVLAETQYSNVVSDYQSYNDTGTNPLRALVYSMPAIIAFIGRKEISRANSQYINLWTNMSLISAGLYFISVFTSGIFIGRLPIYASLFGYMLLPWEINYLYKDNSRFLVYLIMVFSYLAFYYYQMHMVWGMF